MKSSVEENARPTDPLAVKFAAPFFASILKVMSKNNAGVILLCTPVPYHLYIYIYILVFDTIGTGEQFGDVREKEKERDYVTKRNFILFLKLK